MASLRPRLPPRNRFRRIGKGRRQHGHLSNHGIKKTGENQSHLNSREKRSNATDGNDATVLDPEIHEMPHQSLKAYEAIVGAESIPERPIEEDGRVRKSEN